MGMKYIRTKDGEIYKWRYEFEPEKGHWYGAVSGSFLTEDIVKMTDTIEELCDWFACETRHKETGKLLSYYTDFQWWHCEMEAKAQDEMGFSESIVYGAICTPKGLIYVAKMNREGEFELL